MRVNNGKDQDDILKATSLALSLSAMLNESSQDGLFHYVENNYTKETLINIEKLTFAQYKLAHLPEEVVEFAYEMNDKIERKKLSKGESFSIKATPEQLAALKFSNISGNVGLTALYESPLSGILLPDNSISLNRYYSVNGVSTSFFNNSDLVKVTLNYTLSEKAVDGCYQITDTLPSGLAFVGNIYSRVYYGAEQNIWYPYSVDGQKVKFCVTKSTNKPVQYFARPVSKGEFRAEPALIQSLQSSDSLNISEENSVTVN